MSKLLLYLRAIQPAFADETKGMLLNDQGMWNFKEFLKKQEPAFFIPMLCHLPTIRLIYDILRLQIAETLTDSSTADRLPEYLVTRQLQAALTYGELLEHLYALIGSDRKCAEYAIDNNVYQHYLKCLGFKFSADPQYIPPLKKSFEEHLREKTSSTNWYRLFFIRLKKLLNNLVLVQKNIDNVKRLMRSVDSVLNPFLAWLAWLFYLPCLLGNLIPTLYNTLSHFWMQGAQAALGWPIRLRLEWQERWFALCNDSVWLTVGLINCFLLVGPLAPLALYLTVALYTFDIALAGLRAGIAFHRFYRLKQKCEAVMNEKDTTQYDRIELECFLRHYKNQLRYEQARLLLSLATSTALFVGMVLTVPAFAVNPVIPLIGACFIVATCLISLYVSHRIKRLQPKNDFPSILPVTIRFTVNPEPMLRAKSEQQIYKKDRFFHPSAPDLRAGSSRSRSNSKGPVNPQDPDLCMDTSPMDGRNGMMRS